MTKKCYPPKLYYVPHNTISQAERMREKYFFLAENEQWKVQYQGQSDEFPVLTNEQVEKCFKQSEEYYNRALEIDEALKNIKSFNQAEWKYIKILRGAAFQRTALDAEIEMNMIR